MIILLKCVSRLKGLIRKFRNNEELLQDYDNIKREQLKICVIGKVSDSNDSVEHTHYLPHCPAIIEDKATTKIRMVFDANSTIVFIYQINF